MNNANYKIPLVIGITGHRDIDPKHSDGLKDRTREIYKNLIKKYPNTPIVLLTPLADGADRLVAEVGLEEEFKDNITVSVTLPMDDVNYKATFGKGLKSANSDNAVSVKEYDNLIKKIISQENQYVPTTIPMLFDKDKYEQATLDNQRELRQIQYSLVGEYIAIHSNILIAMYDEDEKELPGGTKEIVRKKISGEYEHFNILDEDVTYPENGIVYAISTPKGNKENTDNYQIKKRFPNGEEKLGLDSNKDTEMRYKEFHFLEKINYYMNKIKDNYSYPCILSNEKHNYNLYTQHHKHIECFNNRVDDNANEIINKAKSDIEKLGESSDKLLHKNMRIRRSAAFLSVLYQAKMQGIEKYILVLITITIFSLMVKSSNPNFVFSSYIDILYIVLLLLFFITSQIHKGFKEKTEDYRALSECLRIQTAWNMGNINDAAALYYLSNQKDELGWIRTSARGINIFYLPKEDKETEKNYTLLINKYWVDEQIKYFDKNIIKYKENENSINLDLKVFFTIFLVFTIFFGAIEFLLDSHDTRILFWNLSDLDIFKLLLVGMPATIAVYLKSKQLFDGNKEILKEYTLSLDIFKRAKKLLGNEKKDKQKVYLNLGIEALRENSSWLITRRTKQYNTPS